MMQHIMQVRQRQLILVQIYKCLVVITVNKLSGKINSSSSRKSPTNLTLMMHHQESDTEKSNTTTTTNVLQPFSWDHPSEPVPEENFWTLWCKGRLTEANTLTIRLDATPSGLTSAHLHHPPFFYRPDAFLPPNQQCQRTEGN